MAKQATPKTYSEDEVYTGMCLWECALENDTFLEWLGDGAVERRSNAATLIPLAEAAWKKAHGNGFEDCFDWVFVPEFAEHAMKFATTPGDLTHDKALAIAGIITERPLFIPLKRIYFEQFESGAKRFEYRPYGPRWNETTCRIGRAVTLSLGYGKQRRLNGIITSFDKSSGYTKSDDWITCYGAETHKTGACIGIELTKD